MSLAKMMAFSRVSVVYILILSGFGATLLDDQLALIWKCRDSIISYSSLIEKANSCLPFPNVLCEPFTEEVLCKKFKEVMNNCLQSPNSSNQSSVPSLKFTMPGTKYCGPGNISKSGELGFCKAADSCCKAHDSCPDGSISAGETKYGLTNDGLLTRLNCTCDDELRKCLENANSTVAEIVGILFNNVFRNPCIIYDYPTVCKKELRTSCYNICLESTKDVTKPPEFQFRDPKWWDVTRLLNVQELMNLMSGKC